MSDLTKSEVEALETVDSTDGAEYPYEVMELVALRDKGMVTFSGKRGPGNVWYRVELTDAGREALNSDIEEAHPQAEGSEQGEKVPLLFGRFRFPSRLEEFYSILLLCFVAGSMFGFCAAFLVFHR